MSTDLYGVRVLELAPEARRVRLRVFVVYYDTSFASHQPIPSDRSFFVRALSDHEAFGDDLGRDDRFDEAHVDANAFRTIERFVELERRNFPVTDYSRYADFYYERDGAWKDEDALVQADYDVFVTKAEYLARFHVGQSWGTTAYPTEADALTEADYPALPDFTDARRFTPFSDQTRSRDATVARSMRFSADGGRLLVADDDGGFCVFRVADLEPVCDVTEGGSWQLSPGWTHDGRVAGFVDDGFVAWDLETGAREPIAHFGCAANSAGTRFFNQPHDDAVQLLDEGGRVLYEREGAPELQIYADFDAAGDRCAFVIETEPLRLLDIPTQALRELDRVGLGELAMSPDGRYVLAVARRAIVVLRWADGEILRSLRPKSGYPTCVAWSPDGSLVATSVTDDRGLYSKITLHRTGREILAHSRAPRALPQDSGQDLRDLARLYAQRTESFYPGWDSHVDDDLLDVHVSLARMGVELDLVPFMRREHTRIAARAYESLVAHERREFARARQALADARARVEDFECPAWAHTFVWAPLAAAQFKANDEGSAAAAAEVEASLARARVELDDESNRFQKRAVLARALLAMGRLDDVRALALAEQAAWVSPFHVRLLLDLVDAGAFALLREVFAHWNAGESWDARREVLARLRERGALEHAASLGLDDDDDDDDDDDADADDDDESAAPPQDPSERVAWLGSRGRWAEVYALIDATKPTLRNPLFQQVVDTACARRDIPVLLDALGQLPCGDMNAPGLRALQRALAKLSAPHYRVWHP